MDHILSVLAGVLEEALEEWRTQFKLPFGELSGKTSEESTSHKTGLCKCLSLRQREELADYLEHIRAWEYRVGLSVSGFDGTFTLDISLFIWT